MGLSTNAAGVNTTDSAREIQDRVAWLAGAVLVLAAVMGTGSLVTHLANHGTSPESGGAAHELLHLLTLAPALAVWLLCRPPLRPSRGPRLVACQPRQGGRGAGAGADALQRDHGRRPPRPQRSGGPGHHVKGAEPHPPPGEGDQRRGALHVQSRQPCSAQVPHERATCFRKASRARKILTPALPAEIPAASA